MIPPPRDAWVPAGCSDMTDPDAFLDGPHETFRRMRAQAPVAWHPEAGGGGFWCVTRWQDVRAVSLDQRRDDHRVGIKKHSDFETVTVTRFACSVWRGAGECSDLIVHSQMWS